MASGVFVRRKKFISQGTTMIGTISGINPKKRAYWRHPRQRDIDAQAVRFSGYGASRIAWLSRGTLRRKRDCPLAEGAFSLGGCDTDGMIRCRILDI